MNLNSQSIGKKILWLKHYFDEGDKKTFMNKRGAAIAAGYTKEQATAAGHRCFMYHQTYINKWLDEIGLSESAMKTKLVELLSATETKFFAYQGEVIEEIEVENTAIQLKALKMAVDIKGMNAPTKTENSYYNTGSNYEREITSDMSPKEAMDEYKRILKND